MESNKPPLGVKPRFIHEEMREQELADAIVRYKEAGLKIAIEWVKEYNELVERREAREKKEHPTD